ncbi:4'-phosphopantetheinyl transferase superfamily protein [Brevibacterium daeguense]|uniref:4'-phosphopantetheinyl transferase superfamily protein n=2 Tax=Brevibacterium daeguense TaxID=909936 RepID=A0ABP8EKM9_9MICO
MLSDVLPPGACGEECCGDLAPVGAPAAELAVVQTAAPGRRREYGTVRVLARRALTALAPNDRLLVASHALVPGARGAPTWPEGIVGSMTHCADYRASVVARSSRYATIGLDAELNHELPAAVQDLICRPEEHAMIAELQRRDARVAWSAVVFSAKESVYKAWYPLMGTWLDYGDVAIRIDPERRTFRARLEGRLGAGHVRMLRSRTMSSLTGTWCAGESLILTSASVPRHR